MELEKLIEKLGLVAEYLDNYKMGGKADVCRKASEVIKLMRELIVEENNEKWHRMIDDMEKKDG